MKKTIGLVASAWLLAVAGCSSNDDTTSGPDADVVSGVEDPVKGSPPPKARCPEGFSSCRGKCYDIKRDQNNCGACGVVCPNGTTCCNGTCNGADVYADDRANCGACGHVCSGSSLCCNGACVAQTPNSCGTCGHACGAGELCCDGACTCGNTCSTASTCGAGAECNNGNCECPATYDSCDSGACLHCDGNLRANPSTCTCACPITGTSCGVGQTFNAATCACECTDTTTQSCGPLCCDSSSACARTGPGFADVTCVIG